MPRANRKGRKIESMTTPPTATLEPPIIYEQLGGEAAIKAAVEGLYDRVLGDPLLQPFFVNIDMPRLKAKQVTFLSQALGGPAQYQGPGMKQAHAHLLIEEPHFTRVAEHLVQTFTALQQVPQPLIDQIVTLVSPLASDIVNTPTTTEGHSSNGQPISQNGRSSSARAWPGWTACSTRPVTSTVCSAYTD